MSDASDQSDDSDRGVAEPSQYDAVAVGRIAGRIEIRNVELVYAHFEREDDQALPGDSEQTPPSEATPDLYFDVQSAVDDARGTLAFLLKFAIEGQEPTQFKVGAFFRLTYAIEGDGELATDDISQFGRWNALFNGWPYFREYVSSTVNRAGLPRLVLPVMRVPR